MEATASRARVTAPPNRPLGGAPARRWPLIPRVSTSSRAAALTFGLALVANLLLDMPQLVVASAIASTALGLVMAVTRQARACVLWRSDDPDPAPELRWRAQSFTFLLGGAVLFPVALAPRTAFAIVMSCVAVVLSLLAGLTPFCLGRFVFVLLFPSPPEQQGP